MAKFHIKLERNPTDAKITVTCSNDTKDSVIEAMKGMFEVEMLKGEITEGKEETVIVIFTENVKKIRQVQKGIHKLMGVPKINPN